MKKLSLLLAIVGIAVAAAIALLSRTLGDPSPPEPWPTVRDDIAWGGTAPAAIQGAVETAGERSEVPLSTPTPEATEPQVELTVHGRGAPFTVSELSLYAVNQLRTVTKTRRFADRPGGHLFALPGVQ